MINDVYSQWANYDEKYSGKIRQSKQIKQHQSKNLKKEDSVPFQEKKVRGKELNSLGGGGGNVQNASDVRERLKFKGH